MFIRLTNKVSRAMHKVTAHVHLHGIFGEAHGTETLLETPL